MITSNDRYGTQIAAAIPENGYLSAGSEGVGTKLRIETARRLQESSISRYCSCRIVRGAQGLYCAARRMPFSGDNDEIARVSSEDYAWGSSVGHARGIRVGGLYEYGQWKSESRI